MSKTVTIHVAKITLSQLIARVEAGEEIIIARDKQRRIYVGNHDQVSPWKIAWSGRCRRGYCRTYRQPRFLRAADHTRP
jgi:hypothetical protein